jgi:putative endonuclease
MPSLRQRWGAAREALAEEALARQGYEIVERNWRCTGGEIDRIAWDGPVLCFVEVRARSSSAFGSPAETIGRRKRRKLAQVASAYLARFPRGRSPPARFDVVAIVDAGSSAAPSLEVIKNAFDGES